jgi:hypothetical protein
VKWFGINRCLENRENCFVASSVEGFLRLRILYAVLIGLLFRQISTFRQHDVFGEIEQVVLVQTKTIEIRLSVFSKASSEFR